MATPYKFYLTHISRNAGYRANWEPNRPLELGMIGKLTNGIFDVFTTLEHEGLKAEILKDVNPGELNYTSNDSVEIETKLSGKIPAAGSTLTNADAGFVIDFNSQHAVIFQLQETLTHQIVNMGTLNQEITTRFKNKTWPKEWVIITQLVEAVAATIIVSNSSNNKIELKATANAGIANLKLTDTSLELIVANEKGSSLKLIAKTGVTPLYRVMGVQHPLFGKPQLNVRGMHRTIESDRLKFQEFDPRELEQLAEMEK